MLIIKCLTAGTLLSLFSSKKFSVLSHEPNKHLLRIKALYEEGKLKPVIDKVFALSEVPDALAYFGSGEAKGKICIRCQNGSD